MSEAVVWDVRAPIVPGKPVLLEASAGTGKTYQIASLFLRLVVEYEVAVDKILTMTFTKAATAELRDRIRRRLEEARALFERDAPSEDTKKDVALAQLWSESPTERRLRLTRVEAALGAFDSAAIVTIHGFSQRMLDLFAFESGQESGLELVESSAEPLEELVDDALVWSHVGLSEDAVELLTGLGWKRSELLKVGKAVTAAVEPVVRPEVPAALREPEDIRGRIMALGAWLEEGLAATRDMAQWWETEGRVCLDAMLEARKAGRLKGMQDRWLAGTYDKVASWLSRRPLTAKLKEDDYKWLDETKLQAKCGAIDFASEAYHPLLTRLADFLDFRDEWRQRVRPLAVFAEGLREQLDHELTRRRQLTFDSMLSVLAEAIKREGPGGPLATRIRERFDVALVDEFQDTDAAQWAVLEQVFARSEAKRLVLIGDPKQAIYAFRGADVFVYLTAAEVAGRPYTMTTNWRSDGPYVEAMNTLWLEGHNSFEMPGRPGRAGIDYVTVSAHAKEARVQELPRVLGFDDVLRERRAFEIRWFDGKTLDAGEPVIGSKDRAQSLIAQKVACEALALVSGTGRIADRETPIEPGDLAVLVSTHKEATLIQRALRSVGLPAVVGSTASVFASEAARWLRAWLLAVAGAGRDRMARVCAVTPLFGWTAQELAAALEEADRGESGRWEGWCESLARWSRDFVHGFFRVFEAALDEVQAWPRLLGLVDGERHATDLRHLAELAHREAKAHDWGPDELARWLAEEAPADADKSEGDVERSQRLESDAKAVQISTIHASKGLEYPIVLIPFAWMTRGEKLEGSFVWHDDEKPTEPILELRDASDPGRERAIEKKQAEVRQEQTRLLYVALTRARHHAVVWFGQAGQLKTAKKDADADADQDDEVGGALGSSALGRLLLRAQPTLAFDAKGDNHDEVMGQVVTALDALCARSGAQPTIGWGVDVEVPEGTWAPSHGEDSKARPWRGKAVLESSQSVLSFTRIARRSEMDDEEPEREVMPEVIGGSAAPDGGDGPAGADAGEEGTPELEGGEPEPGSLGGTIPDGPCHLDKMWGGKAVGIWIHSVFEALDYQKLEGRQGEDLRTLVEKVAGRSAIAAPEEQLALVTESLPRIVATPLGGGEGVAALPAEFSLASLSLTDRLDELRFDLRVDPGAELASLPERVREALSLRRGEDWLGAGWLEQVVEASQRPLLPARSGVLVGAIDLVFRAKDETGHRYFISDFKTNKIQSKASPRGSWRWHYTPRWMAWEMARHAYHLQALIYTLALHRHLRLRLPDYDYDRHVGGHLYLFLRGMEGEATPELEGTRLGVFRDRWPREVVLALDEALGGGR